MAKTAKHVTISIGTHTWSPEDVKVDRIVESMKKHGLTVLDTARVYVSRSIRAEILHNR